MSIVGEEAVAAGVCAVLRPDDYITSTHRGHGHAIAKGVGLDRLMAELYGKATGVCKGRGGSMHVADFSLGMLGANGIVAAGCGIAAGAALSAAYRRSGQVAVSFFGDGGINKGSFHEALNFAAVRRLPVVYACENNQYAQYTAVGRTTSVDDLSRRAEAYGIPGQTVDGNDAIAVFQAASVAVERARAGEGPTLLNLLTYRFGGHFVGDAEEYRAKEEVEGRREHDPIPRLEGRLVAEGIDGSAGARAGPRSGRRGGRRGGAVRRGKPVPGVGGGARGRVHVSERQVSFGQATLEAMQVAMREDERVIVLGEDIGWGGSFGQFRGLLAEFGPERVVDMPISEAQIVSACVGAAVTGLRPVGSISFVEFTMGAMDEIVNQAAKLRYMFGGQVSVPLVLRASDGTLRSSAAQHSESFEAIFAHVPGLKVVAPSTPADAKGLLAAAIADDDPVVYLENKKIGSSRGPVPEGRHEVPIGEAAIRREGADVTILAYSIMARHAEQACAAARRGGDRGRARRSAQSRAARSRDRARVGAERPGALSSATRRGRRAGSAPRSRRGSPRSSSTSSRRRLPGSGHRPRTSRSARPWSGPSFPSTRRSWRPSGG